MAAKKWLQERWPVLVAALEPLTVEQEAEIERLCLDEMAYWKNEQGANLGTLGNLVSQTRGHLKAHFTVLNASNSWVNPRKGAREHISLKYMNLSKEDWAKRMVPSEEAKEARLQDRQVIDNPDLIVERAASLLSSRSWEEITTALAVLTGRRLTELLTAGSLSPKTRYSAVFTGQLKTKDRAMVPYEIPTLIESALVLAGLDRLRSLVAGFTPDEDALTGVADRLFSDIVPPRSGGSLYTHLFRSVYGAIAVFYFCPEEVLEAVYLNRVYGQYWVIESSGQLQADYAATQHYQDYRIANAVIAAHNGQGQGVKLNDEGVELLGVFQNKPVVTTKRGAKMATKETTTIVKSEGQTDFSMIKPRKTTKARIDQFVTEENITDSSPYDAALLLLLERNYTLKTLAGYGESLDALLALLVGAADDVRQMLEDAKTTGVSTYTAKKRPLPQNAVAYLRDVLSDKRDFQASYGTRAKGRDYSAMPTSELRKHKTEDASVERFRRAVDAIKAYNLGVQYEMRWYINAATVCALVGGAPTIAKTWLESQPDVAKHHTDLNLHPGINRRGIQITERVTVPELPSASSSEAVIEETKPEENAATEE